MHMNVKGLSKRGTANSYNIDLGEMLSDASSPFQFLLESDRSIYYQDFLNESQIILYRDNNRRAKPSNTVHINEVTKTELVREADYPRKARAKKLVTHYKGVSNRYGWITFNTNSQYTPGRKYTQYIKLKEAKDMKYFHEFNKRDIIRLFMSGDLQVFCQCPDFRYRFKYMASQLGYGIYKETRFPGIRNPNLEGSVCKHLLAVFSVLGMNWTLIARDMQRTKFFKNKYGDDTEDIPKVSKNTRNVKNRKKISKK